MVIELSLGTRQYNELSIMKNPVRKHGVLLKKKPHRLGVSRPEIPYWPFISAFMSGVFWLFHVDCYQEGKV